MDVTDLSRPQPGSPTRRVAITIGFAVALVITLCGATAAETQQPGEKPSAIGHTQLEGVLTCTLESPPLSGDAQIDRIKRAEYERRPDRILHITIRDEGRSAVVSAPLFPRSAPFEITFVANRNVFNLFIEKSTISSSVYAVSRGLPKAGVLGEMVHMSAASGGFARRYECSWSPREP
jgi:hypothetical protein